MEVKTHPFRYFEYKLPNGRSVFLSNRPDVCDPNQIWKFLGENNPKIRFMFTDDYAVIPGKKEEPEVNTHWYCWIPGRDPAIEDIWTALLLMSRFDKMESIKYPMWMHCDSSTMRAPTFFGLYLNAVYPDKVKEICDPVRDWEKENGGRQWGWPDQYAEVEMRRNENTKNLIEYWQRGAETQAHYFMNNVLKNRLGSIG
jgi:hypothetical protein